MFYSTKRYIIYLLIILSFYTFAFNFLFCRNDCGSSQQTIRTDSTLPTIYLITPTHNRHEQLADLTRLSQTLLLVPKLHWLIIEDSPFKTDKIEQFILNLVQNKKPKFNSDILVDHFYAETPLKYKIQPDQPNWSKTGPYGPKGVFQRNLALEFLTNNFSKLDRNGIIYFLDDDNTYDVQLFGEMRSTRKVSIWPVGLAGQLLVEKPILNDRNQVVRFNSVWKSERKYPIDMAGFAIKLSFYILKSSPKFYIDAPIGYQETQILNQLLDDYSELEPKADHCTKVYVWHTQTVKFRVSRKVKESSF